MPAPRSHHRPPRGRAPIATAATLAVALLLTGCTSATTGSGGPVVTSPGMDDDEATTPVPTNDGDPTSPAPGPPSDLPTATPTAPTTPTPDPDVSPSPSTPTSGEGPATAADTQQVSVYWWAPDAMSVVEAPRTVAGPGIAAAAVRALIDGPTEDEAASGLGSSMPSDTLLLGLTIRAGTATVDLSREFEFSGAGGTTADLARLAQLTYTLTQFPQVDLVHLRLDGEPVDLFSGHGIEIGKGMRRADFVRELPIGAAAVSDPTWDEAELPPVPAGGQALRVVRVAEDDLLNVRERPGADRAVIGRLRPGARVPSTGRDQRVAGSTWVELRTPRGLGWANGTYLVRDVAADEFPEAAARAVVDEFGRRLRDGGDLRPLVSDHGLWIVHHDAPVVVDRADLVGILDDPTNRRWGSKALESGSPEIRPETFAEAVAEPFVDAWDDDDNQVLALQTVQGPNGRPAAAAIPSEFRGFPWITVHDPGDDAEYGGLDWQQWIVSLDVADDGTVTVVGLTLDEWAP